MRLSIIVPTYNRKELLDETLQFLLAQEPVEGVSVEIIVVDDGSNDGSADLVRALRADQPHLELVIRKRTDPNAFTAAAARNAGIARATGEWVSFVDVGIVGGRDFVAAAVEHARKLSEKAVILHRVLGLRVRDLDAARLDVEGLTPSNATQRANELRRKAEWCDHREALMDSVGDDLMLLPAPWTLGWTAALTVDRGLVRAVEGFDEGFSKWGSEDNDFSYRLYQMGGRFSALREPALVHLPHSTALRNYITNLENRKRTHERFGALETEVHVLFPRASALNMVLAQLENLLLSEVLPTYSDECIAWLGEQPPGTGLVANALIIGAGDARMAAGFPRAHLLAHSRRAARTLRASNPNRSVLCSLGCYMLFPARQFAEVIITDYWRLMAPRLLAALVTESVRVGHRVTVLHTENFESRAAEFLPGSWSSVEALEDAVRRTGLQLSTRGVIGETRAFTVREFSEESS